MPPMPANVTQRAEPDAIFQVQNEEQLTPELAELKPNYLYAPVLVMAEHFDRVMPFLTNGTVPVAVLPRVITDDETEEIYRALEKLQAAGVRQALVGNLGHVAMARQAGMEVRGDFGGISFRDGFL